MVDLKLPAVCDFSVTNVCNAACDFCGFVRDKTLAGAARYADADAFSRALPILHRRGIRYLTLQGGEPLVHPDIVRLVSQTVAAGISCAIITNGWDADAPGEFVIARRTDVHKDLQHAAPRGRTRSCFWRS